MSGGVTRTIELTTGGKKLREVRYIRRMMD